MYNRWVPNVCRRTLSNQLWSFYKQSLVLSRSKGYSNDCSSNELNVESLCQKWSQIYKRYDIPDPVSSAELIIAHAMGKKMIHEIPPCFEINEALRKRIDELCSQRLERKPVQYIIGEWDFMDLTLKMRQPVLIPRPETEELCELIAKEVLQTQTHKSSMSFLDIGCGSGAIGVYLLKHLPHAECIAVDKSFEACDLTMINADRLHLSARIHVLQGDITEDCLLTELQSKGQFDMIISNPPYIPSADMQKLMPEVQRYESHEALDGGIDGLNIIRRILDISRILLKTEGILWLETDVRHPVLIKDIVTAHPQLGLELIYIFNDFTQSFDDTYRGQHLITFQWYLYYQRLIEDSGDWQAKILSA